MSGGWMYTVAAAVDTIIQLVSFLTIIRIRKKCNATRHRRIQWLLLLFLLTFLLLLHISVVFFLVPGVFFRRPV
jgi:hypothetical protein